MFVFLILWIAVCSIPAGSEETSWPVVVSIPPQEREISVPVVLDLAGSPLPMASGTEGWRLTGDGLRIPAQVVDSRGRRLVFLLPVSPSQSETLRTLRLELVPTIVDRSFRFEDSGQMYLHLREREEPVLTYNYGMLLKPGVPEDRRRSSYVHPLYAPGATALTDDFPRDHYHHRGLFWTWPNIDVDGKRHNLWDIRGIRQIFEGWQGRERGPVFARVDLENSWFVEERRVARERVIITAFRTFGGCRVIDVTLVFMALSGPIVLAGELPDRKGYGGFSLRFAPREETVLTCPGGRQEKDSDGVPFPWADLSARFIESGKQAGAAIFVHSANPGFPNGWTLRHYGFLGVAWPGLESATLEAGKPLVLRYRVLVHSADADKAGVAAHYAAYLRPPRAALAPGW